MAALLYGCLLEVVAVSEVFQFAAMQQPLLFPQQILHAYVAISFASIPVDLAA